MSTTRSLALLVLLPTLAACGEYWGDECDPAELSPCMSGECVSCSEFGLDAYVCADDAYDPFLGSMCADLGGTGTGGGCGAGSYDACYSAWTCAPDGQGESYCMAACGEGVNCNQAGVDANCGILQGFDAAGCCSACN